MFTFGESAFNIFDIFIIIILLLSIIQIIVSIILNNQVNSKLKNYKIKEVKDIDIAGLKSIKFIKNKSKPIYNPKESNLGYAGELIIDCYVGTCTKQNTLSGTERICSKSPYDDDTDCVDGPYNITKYENIIDFNCSSECFEIKGKNQNSFSSSSKCSNCLCEKITNDKYSNGKYCLSKNAIYFWKAQKYEAEGINSDFSYLKNAMLKNEECPNKTKNCGILDDNENKLCIPDNLECPINIISEEKLNISNSSFKIGNKTFYYDYDKNAKNKKIIAGLYVDISLEENKIEEDYFSLDKYTIKDIFEENKILFKGVTLGNAPYSDKDINKKGKSYLKIKYNENVDLVSLRDNYYVYLTNKDKENEEISKITNHFGIYNKLGIVGYSYLIFILIIFILIGFVEKNKNKNEDSLPQPKIKTNFLYYFIPSLIPFLTLSLFPVIKSCIIIKSLNEIDEIIDISINLLCTTNIIFIALSFFLYGLILVFIVIFCINKKRKNIPDKQETKNINNLTQIALNSSSKSQPIQIKN